MVRFLTDFNFDGRIIRGVLRQRPQFDLVRGQDVGVAEETPDPELLEWAAQNDRILVTHDRNTMSGFAYDRVAAGLSMPGVIIVARTAPIRQIIEDMLLIDFVMSHIDYANRVEFLPL